MYAETGLLLPYFQNLPPDVQQFDDFCSSHKSTTYWDNLIQATTISDYDLVGEGDFFKAPEPLLEQPLITIDPMTSTMSQELKVSDVEIVESLQNEELLNDVFNECHDILAKEAATRLESSPLSEVLSFSFPVVPSDENSVVVGNVHPTCQISKSMSSDSLNTMNWVQGTTQTEPGFLTFNEIDFGNAYGMRRAFSEGDIKTLTDTNRSIKHYPLAQPRLLRESISEDRVQKLSRYRSKKTKRNFGRKIKYACRKALADSQLRVRGRFAKTDESDTFTK